MKIPLTLNYPYPIFNESQDFYTEKFVIVKRKKKNEFKKHSTLLFLLKQFSSLTSLKKFVLKNCVLKVRLLSA